MRTFAEVHLIDKNCNHGADDRTEEVFFDEKVEQVLRLKSHSDAAGNGTADGNQSAEHVEGDQHRRRAFLKVCETGTGDDAEERKNEVGDAENQIHRLQRGIGRIHIFCGYAENFIRSARELHNAVQSAYDRVEPECEVDEEMKPFQSLVFFFFF